MSKLVAVLVAAAIGAVSPSARARTAGASAEAIAAHRTAQALRTTPGARLARTLLRFVGKAGPELAAQHHEDFKTVVEHAKRQGWQSDASNKHVLITPAVAISAVGEIHAVEERAYLDVLYHREMDYFRARLSPARLDALKLHRSDLLKALADTAAAIRSGHPVPVVTAYRESDPIKIRD